MISRYGTLVMQSLDQTFGSQYYYSQSDKCHNKTSTLEDMTLLLLIGNPVIYIEQVFSHDLFERIARLHYKTLLVQARTL